MAEIILVRHGKTAGNLEGRYIGSRTDEPLCEEGIHALEEKVREGIYPPVDLVYASPMIRCRQTAKILWPEFVEANEAAGVSAKVKLSGEHVNAESDMQGGTCRSGQIQVLDDLRECDFGAFENKNYQELSGNADYQAWIDSNGTLPFPGGESNEAFRQRCCQAFLYITEELQKQEEKTGQTLRAAVVVHGGTIMAILEHFGTPKKNYFDYQVKNGCGYRLTPVEGTDQWNYQYLQ